MHPAITKLEAASRKPAIAQVQSGDTVRVHQLIREGSKQRVQVFEGVVIRTDRMGSTTASITVRRIASGVGVEKSFLMHSPNVEKVEVIRRSKVRRNFMSFLRDRRGKSARLKEVSFDRTAANVQPVKDEVVAEDPLASDEELDAEVTELNVEETQEVHPETSTEEIAKEEEKAAAADEPSADDGDGDESVAEQEEAESGADRAEAEEDRESTK
ncbi:50S ribosomal protein L19 [Patescibacteria group bacterium]|nr:MAG: 50S ribosomal protein L19 [Patescibacteria group bacterium]